MTNEDFAELWFPATVNLFERGDYEKLDTALGVAEFDGWINRVGIPRKPDVPLSDNLKHLLKALAGPHAKTILRAYQIKHGIKTEEKVDD